MTTPGRRLRSGPELVTLGETMVLFLAEPGIPLDAATAFRRSVAGAESNVAVGVSRLGHTAGWVGRVGDDPLGRVVLRALRAESVDVGRAVVDGSGAATGLLVRDCHPDRRVEVSYHRQGSAGSRLHPDDVDPDYVAGAQVLHVTALTGVLSPTALAAVEAAVAAARAAGVAVCLDTNVRLRLAASEQWVAVTGRLAPAADLVLAGDDEARLVSGRRDRRGAAEWFLDRGARLVVLTAGAAGSWATDGVDTWDQPAVAVRAADPVGAGDAFDAGFLAAWLRGLDVPAALREAATVAALCVGVPTDVDGLPTAEQRDAHLAGGADVQR